MPIQNFWNFFFFFHSLKSCPHSPLALYPPRLFLFHPNTDFLTHRHKFWEFQECIHSCSIMLSIRSCEKEEAEKFLSFYVSGHHENNNLVLLKLCKYNRRWNQQQLLVCFLFIKQHISQNSEIFCIQVLLIWCTWLTDHKQVCRALQKQKFCLLCVLTKCRAGEASAMTLEKQLFLPTNLG